MSAAIEPVGADERLPAWQARVVDRSLGPATDRAVQRGRALVTAAGRLIRLSGGDDLTMKEVAAEAGLSLRVLYQHFEGKDDLLVALIEESQVVFARLIERQAATRQDPLERLGAALYFAADPRQHTDPGYNRALATFVARTSISEPERLGRARLPVVEVIGRLISDAMSAGEVDPGDPEIAASSILLTYISYELNNHLGSSVGAPLPTTEQFVAFCIRGLGARIPDGWERQFRLSDEEAARSAVESVRLSGTEAGGGGSTGRRSRRGERR